MGLYYSKLVSIGACVLVYMYIMYIVSFTSCNRHVKCM